MKSNGPTDIQGLGAYIAPFIAGWIGIEVMPRLMRNELVMSSMLIADTQVLSRA